MGYFKKLQKGIGASPVFRSDDLRRIFPKLSNGYSRLLLHNLVKNGQIFRLSKGVYSFSEEISMIGFAFSPFYYGCENALSIHGIWEQEANPVVITPRKVRSGIRGFNGSNYLVRRISRKMFFGFESVRQYDLWMPVSDIEKTLIDCAYYDVYLQKSELGELKSRLNPAKLSGYLKRSPKWLGRKVKKLLSLKK
ncbi:MAG: hypothetical protein AABY04_01685 [Candidatus Micrarchaeota archaeon]